MCLYLASKEVRPKIAKKDIIVYKRCILDGYELHGSYQREYIYNMEGNVMEAEMEIENCYTINKGFSSFRYKKSCIKHTLSWGWTDEWLCEFIIPKGTTYYTGTFDNHCCYVSDKIKFKTLLYQMDEKNCLKDLKI